jgi:site-specific DNA recombinase
LRAVSYIRVSDASQVDGHSLDAQERLYRELCKTREWDAVRVYREEGRSAKHDAIARRPVLRQLLDDAAQGEFDVVIVHTLDRWARNLRVSLETQGMLARHNVMLVSITEQIDYTTPEGRFMMQMLGGLAELYSGTLGKHVQKGVGERVQRGLHLGGVPFGYRPCSLEGCEPIHQGGVHQVDGEVAAVRELFNRYATGTTTCVELAAWMNSQGFRTRNRHRVNNEEPTGRFFTSSSVRGLLHNAFFSGQIKHHDLVVDGAHEPVISRDLFENVQALLKRNSGRSRTLQPKAAREYLLKGIIRCAHCGMPMCAQTYANGHRYYREHRGSRGEGTCVNVGGSVACEVVDEQVGRFIENMMLPEDWLEAALERISLRDEVARVRAEREQLREKLRRLGKAYVDSMVDEADYERHKAQLEFDLASLVVPEADAVAEAGRLVQHLPELWAKADLSERRRLLLTVLDAVYVDTRNPEISITIRPKAVFEPLFSTVEELIS